MKRKLLLLLTSVALLSLTSCKNVVTSSSASVSESTGSDVTSVTSVPTSSENVQSSSSISSESINSTNSSSVSSSEDIGSSSGNKYDDSYYVTPEGYEEVHYKVGSTSGALIDASIDKRFITGQEDTFGFAFANPYSATSTVEVSDERIMKIEKISETEYKIKCLHEGNVVLTINDANGITRYQKMLYVRDPYTLSEMNDYLSEVEYWQAYAGLGDNYKLTFLFDNQVGISGSLENVPFESYTATFKFKEETDLEYRYVFTDEKSKENEARLVGFNVSKAGDIMYLQYTSGTAALMFPNTYFEK